MWNGVLTGLIWLRIGSCQFLSVSKKHSLLRGCLPLTGKKFSAFYNAKYLDQYPKYPLLDIELLSPVYLQGLAPTIMIVCRLVRLLFSAFVLLNIRPLPPELCTTHIVFYLRWCIRNSQAAETYRLHTRTWVQRFEE